MIYLIYKHPNVAIYDQALNLNSTVFKPQGDEHWILNSSVMKMSIQNNKKDFLPKNTNLIQFVVKFFVHNPASIYKIFPCSLSRIIWCPMLTSIFPWQHCGIMCVNIVSLSGKRKSLQASYILSLCFSISAPPWYSSPSLSLLPSYPRWTTPCLCLQGVLRTFITVAMVTPQQFDSGPGHSSSLTLLLFLSPSIPLSLSSSVFPLKPPPPFPVSTVPPAPLKTWLPDKNHQITAASGAYDDGTTPWGFPLSPINDWSNHNVLTLWSQVSIPLFSLSSSLCLSVCLLPLFFLHTFLNSRIGWLFGLHCRDRGTSCWLFCSQISWHPIKHGNIDLTPHFWGLVFPLKGALFETGPWWKCTWTHEHVDTNTYIIYLLRNTSTVGRLPSLGGVMISCHHSSPSCWRRTVISTWGLRPLVASLLPSSGQ